MIRHYLRALKDAGLLDGGLDELSALEVLQQALAEQLPARPTPQQVPSLESWRELIEAILTPPEEAPAGLGESASGVPVPERRGEELEEAMGGTLAGRGNEG